MEKISYPIEKSKLQIPKSTSRKPKVNLSASLPTISLASFNLKRIHDNSLCGAVLTGPIAMATVITAGNHIKLHHRPPLFQTRLLCSGAKSDVSTISSGIEAPPPQLLLTHGQMLAPLLVHANFRRHEQISVSSLLRSRSRTLTLLELAIETIRMATGSHETIPCSI